jgi:hypothetical protein
VPQGAEVRSATSKRLSFLSPTPLPVGAVLECDLLLGARPIPAMARVVSCSAEAEAGKHAVDVEFVAMAQVDRDTLADFLQALGPASLRLREHREE